MHDIIHGAKRKTIKAIIQKKLNEWLATLPEQLRLDVEEHVIVTGGCIASLLLGESIKDFDLYLDDQVTVAKLAYYYVELFNENRKVNSTKTTEPYVKVEYDRVRIFILSAGIAASDEDGSTYAYFENPADAEGANEYIDKLINEKENTESTQAKYRPIFLSENAISLSDKIQIVIRFIGPPEEIHKNYDYVHATNYYYSKTKELVLKATALESLLARDLVYCGSLYPVCSLFRMRKFMDRGWRISAGEITKIALQISELDLADPVVLREQLIGVDAAYFHQLINMINTYREKNPGVDINASYVIELIDELADRGHV